MQPQKFRFTKTNIQELPFSQGENDRPEYRDTGLPGLVLRVGKIAKTYYLYRYNEHFKRHEKLKLGSYLQLDPGHGTAGAGMQRTGSAASAEG